MLKGRIISLVIMLLILVGTVFAQDDPQTIAELVAGNEDFSTLLQLLEAAELTEVLAEAGEFTVFAPTNAAFSGFDEFVVEYLRANPVLTTRILTHHVVDRAIPSEELAELTTIRTMDAGVGGITDLLLVNVDGETAMIDQATIIEADIEASNGVIHVIDEVLMPNIDLPQVIAADVDGDIVTAGSSTVGPLTVRIVDEFFTEGYTGAIDVDIIGSGAGFERFCGLAESDADIVNASRRITEAEIDACAELETPRTPIEFRVGTDALAVVVNPSNTFVNSLTLSELQVAFSVAETWADVNPDWPEDPIVRFIPGTESGTFDYFVEEIFDGDALAIQSAANVQLSEDDNFLLDSIARNDDAIGFFGYAYYTQNEEDVKILNIEGISPIRANVDNASYPLARPLFIYSDARIMAEKPQVSQFITYYLTVVNDVIDEVGYFPSSPAALEIARLKLLALTDAG